MADRKTYVIFIAGPFRAENAWLIERNIRAAEETGLALMVAAEACEDFGIAALIPHTLYRFFQGAAPDRVWLDADMEMLRRCDGALFIDGWQASTGAVAEYNECERRDIPIYHSIPTALEVIRARRTGAIR